MTNAPVPTSDESVYFPSLVSLRAAHTDLLKRHRETGETPETLAAVAAFLQRGQATGALLDDDDDRRAAQSLLNYWATVLYRAGQEPPEATLADFDPALAPELPDALCPYLGLDAFREDNSAVFFGRQRLIESLINHLQENRLLAVVGPSGSGKSSVVRAGLIPALQAGVPASDSADWHYLPPMFPGSNPLENLAHVTRPPEIDAAAWVPSQIVAFQQDDGYLAKLIAARGLGRVVIVVDQFEEVFTLCTDDNVRQAFVDNLVRLIRAPQARHTVILTMRTDFETQVTRLPDFEPLFEQALIRVTPLNAGELREAIEKPAAAIGLKFEAGVVDALLRDILGEPAALPLLQFTLLKLWESRERNRVTWEAYRRLGGGRQALATSADEFYRNLIQEEQDTAKRILLRLVRPGEGLEFTSNRVRREVLFHKAEARDRVERVLDKFIRARLLRLTRGETEADDQVEVAHEALVRNWPRLVGWLEDERVAMRQRQRLTTAAEQWVALGRDPGALLRGVLLDEALRTKDLNELENEFVRASAAAREAEEEERVRAREQALQAEMAQKMAEVERRRAEEQTRAAWFLRVAFGVAIILFIVAVVLAGQRNNSAISAQAANTQSAQNLQTATAALILADQQNAIAVAAAEALATAEAETRAKNTTIEQQRQEALAGQLAAQAINLLGRQQYDLALLLSVQANQVRQTRDAQNALLESLNAVRPIAARQTLTSAYLYPIVFSPDGARLAAASDNSLLIWDTRTGQLVYPPLAAGSGPIGVLVFSPDGQQLASADANGALTVWSLSGREPAPRIITSSSLATALVFSPDGQTLASGGYVGSITLWDLTEPAPAAGPLSGGKAQITALAFSPGGASLAAGDSDGAIQLWDLTARAPTSQTLAGHTSVVTTLAFSPDEILLASGSADTTVKVWEAATGQLARSFSGHTNMITRVAFNPSGFTLASSSADATLRLWDIAQGALLRTLSGHLGGIGDAAFVSEGDGQKLVSADTYGALIHWDLERTAVDGQMLAGHTSPLVGLAFSTDGQTLASGSSDNTLRRWDAASGDAIGVPLRGTTDAVFPLTIIAVSPDGRTLAAGGADGSVLLWDLQENQQIGMPFNSHSQGVSGIAFSPDGQTLATTAYTDNFVRLWSLGGQEPVSRTLTALTGLVSAAFSPALGSPRLAAGGTDGTVVVWDLSGSQPISVTLTGHVGTVFSVAFSPDGEVLASAGSDAVICLWAVDTDELCGKLEGHTTRVNTIAFSPSGKMLASGSDDTTVRLWDVMTRQPVGQPLQGHTNWVNSVAFSPDSQRLASASQDATIRLWDLTEPDLPELPYLILARHVDGVASVAFRSENPALVSAGLDRDIILWDTSSAQPVETIRGQTSAELVVTAFALSPDGRTLAAGGADGLIQLWTGGATQHLKGHTGRVAGLAFSPDGQTLISASEDRSLRLWDVATGQPRGPALTSQKSPITALALSPDGQTLASGDQNGRIILWENASAAPQVRDQFTSTIQVNSLAFSADGQMLASADANGILLIFDVVSRQLLDRDDTGNAYSLAFSPDNRRLASIGFDNRITLWDVEARQLQILGQIPLDYASGLAFSPDGKTLTLGASDGTIYLLEADPQQWIARACRVAVRNLYFYEWHIYLPDQPYEVICEANPVDYYDISSNYLEQARFYAQVNQRELAKAAYGRAVDWADQSDNADINADVCRAGSENDFLDTVRAACQKAIALATDDGLRAEMYALSGQAEEAAALIRALAEAARRTGDFYENDSLCERWSFTGYAELTIPACKRAATLASEYDTLLQADLYALAGEKDKAAELFRQVMRSARDAEDALLSNNICWRGSIDGFAELVLPACDYAVGREFFNFNYLDSRGLARALTGDYAGAIEDFRVYADSSGDVERAAQRESWIVALMENRNPFDLNTLKILRSQ